MRVTLVSDGSSDKTLLPAIRWLLAEHGVGDDLDTVWADFRFMRVPPVGLKAKVLKAIDSYPFDLLFVHRDAENVTIEDRRQEIRDVVREIESEGALEMRAVCTIPIRMTEAWLLVEESAIRQAAGNPEGRMRLALPALNQIESKADPKGILFQALKTASGHTGRRLAKLDFPSLRYRVAELITDHARLRKLSAFRALEAEVAEVIEAID